MNNMAPFHFSHIIQCVMFLVIGLSYASKYFTVAEKLIRKRIIPVITTLYVLASVACN